MLNTLNLGRKTRINTGKRIKKKTTTDKLAVRQHNKQKKEA